MGFFDFFTSLPSEYLGLTASTSPPKNRYGVDLWRPKTLDFTFHPDPSNGSVYEVLKCPNDYFRCREMCKTVYGGADPKTTLNEETRSRIVALQNGSSTEPLEDIDALIPCYEKVEEIFAHGTPKGKGWWGTVESFI